MSRIFELPETQSGKTWFGFTASASSTGSHFANPLASVVMVFKLAGVEALRLTSADSEITITDAAAWNYRVEKVQALSLPVGIYSWEVETISTTGDRFGYFVGTLPVTNDGTP